MLQIRTIRAYVISGWNSRGRQKFDGLGAESADMVKTLERAIAEVERLPTDMQEKIGRELLAHVEKLRSLRADLAKGLQSLDDGQGRELDMEDVIKRSRRRNAKG
jgi:hypothetical protein